MRSNRGMTRLLRSVAGTSIFYGPFVVLTILLPTVARADIFQWQWIDDNDHSLGKMQSPTLCIGGAGVSAAPGSALSSRNLTQAYLVGANLNHAYMQFTKLNDADLSGADLTGAIFTDGILLNANFSGAVIV